MSVLAQPAPVKSTGTAYLFWFFFGSIGAHKFYLGAPLKGAAYLAAWAGFWALLVMKANFVVACVPLAALWVALFIDMFTLPGQTRAANLRAAGVEAPAAKASTSRLFQPRDEPFDAGAADAAIARYISQTAAAQVAPGRSQARAAGRPAFGRR